MKSKLFFLIAYSFSLTAAAQTYKGDSWATVKANGSGKLSVVYYEQPGLIYLADGKMKGVCVDILSDFQKYVETKYAKKITVEYEGEEKEFSNFLKVAQKTANIIGVTNTSITDERKRIMKFSPPFMTTQLVLLTNKTAPALLKLEDMPKTFEGFTAQVISGSTHVNYIEEIKKQYFPTLPVTYAASSESVIKNLSTNPKLFSILDFTEYIGVVKKKVPVKRHDIELGNPEPLGFIMSKQTDWDVLFKEFLTEEYRKSVHYKEIIAENLGAAFLSLVK
ncbi:MAG TPA: transporter substrate-binding domain-containing protein [Chryseosolibacter sp.]